jgi:hypothetical protein
MITHSEWHNRFSSNAPWGPFLPEDLASKQTLIVKQGLLLFKEPAPAFEGGYIPFLITDKSNSQINHCGKSISLIEFYKNAKPYEARPTKEKSIVFWLIGVGSQGYTKTYSSAKEALEELELFSANEPLDFESLVKDFQFYFTN